MGTRAAIAIKERYGYSVIFNNWDGYPDYLGTMLNAHYKSYEKVKSLISLGSVSMVAELVEPRNGEIHTFDKPLDYVTIAYARDTGDNSGEHDVVKVKELKQVDFGEYLYVYIPSKREWDTYKCIYDPNGTGKTAGWGKIENINYDKFIMDWILQKRFIIHPRGYDKITGIRRV